MGELLPFAVRVPNFARIISSERINTPKQAKPISNIKISPSAARVDPAQLGLRMKSSSGRTTRVPLSEVVSDCVEEWFQDTLKKAEAGDYEMQLLVGQMYNSGYGVRKDTEKGRTWITRASKGWPSALESSNKHPGYNASDLDSEDLKDASS